MVYFSLLNLIDFSSQKVVIIFIFDRQFKRDGRKDVGLMNPLIRVVTIKIVVKRR